MMKQNIAVTTDVVVFFRSKKMLKILLVQRKNEPFKGKWALPGGFLEEEEPLEKGALRELKEETGLELASLKQLQAFGSPARDPRGRTVTIAFLGEVFSEEKVRGADDASEAKWFDVHFLPSLAFDHHEIIELALLRYNSKSINLP